MMTPMRLLMLAVVAGTLTLAGCSYTPARVQSRPLIEIDGYSGHRHYHGDDRRYYDRRYSDRHHHRRVERHYYYDDDRRRGGFCPPGLRMQGRC
ncbi:hypothetical protein [Halomonas kalidii]|uniref:Lipoprotein n=1 Tax=Halomonas kalidii TaxID=3043293 RepID=A0ABT6VSC6_9GAMM|nr:hypothetical protein [Halomonas kalidii]MDI5936439.1 hypothetical protein [Halomonas kalidii]